MHIEFYHIPIALAFVNFKAKPDVRRRDPEPHAAKKSRKMNGCGELAAKSGQINPWLTP